MNLCQTVFIWVLDAGRGLGYGRQQGGVCATFLLHRRDACATFLSGEFYRRDAWAALAFFRNS
jgi:hypothetical protein